VDAPEASGKADWLTAISKSDYDLGIGLFATAGKGHRPLAGQWIARHVLAGGPSCDRKYSLPYLWNTKRLFFEGEPE